MAGGAMSPGTVICFHCRRRGGGPCGPECRTRAAPAPKIVEDKLTTRVRRLGRVGLAFAGAALAGAVAGALLALLTA